MFEFSVHVSYGCRGYDSRGYDSKVYAIDGNKMLVYDPGEDMGTFEINSHFEWVDFTEGNDEDDCSCHFVRLIS